MLQAFNLDGVGDLVSTIGLPDFGGRYFHVFKDTLGIDLCTVFAFRGSASPTLVLVEADSTELGALARRLANDYVAGAFVEDPNVRGDRCYQRPSVQYLSATQIKNMHYRLRFYDTPSVAHELALLGQMDDVLYYASFYRVNSHGAFQQRDLDLMDISAQFVIKTVHRHFVLQATADFANLQHGAQPLSPEQRHAMYTHLRDLLLTEPHTLSQREAEVCAAISLGYTSLAISLKFGISVNTVATHRKRAYRKLGICSQSELFSRYLQAANQPSLVA